MRKSTDTSRVALGDLNHYWTLEDEREFIQLKDDMTAEELAEHFNRDIYEVIVEGLHIKRLQERLEQLEREEGLEYNSMGEMLYNPLYHAPKGKPWTTEDLVYLCKYHDIDGIKKISLALDRTPRTCGSQIGNLRTSGMYQHYRNWEELA